MIYGLTQLGVVHTIISLIAVAAGAIAFVRYGRISPGVTVGKVYVITTVLTCLTGFGIFQHGGFGKPHMLGILTLVMLGIAAIGVRHVGIPLRFRRHDVADVRAQAARRGTTRRRVAAAWRPARLPYFWVSFTSDSNSSCSCAAACAEVWISCASS